MNIMNRKYYLLVAVLIALTSSNLYARGGGQGFGGYNAISKVELEASWNGQAGPQHTAVRGVKVQWYADVCGTANGHATDVKQCINDNAKSPKAKVVRQ
ncbi:hypothetical protein [Shewanella sp. MBTL60-007]|uniref:hypothetical protein n=1 Tax=Shewanella sp. MBTL60-007 TaxID=2815911 RepID=UPI001BC33F50|nr:hypothetical protein [Shewanella sp. MBTL60-007]GIU29058.1 hypothetical protein TUM3792_38450 [Shewanella sp. MBTL60-007]